MTVQELINAIKEGDEKKIKELLESLEKVSEEERKSFFNTAEKKDLEYQANDGTTLLMYAAQYNLPQVVEGLIAKGVDINIKNKDDDTALILASHEGHIEIVKKLLEQKADINIRNKQGETAFTYAVKNNHPDVVAVLINDPNLTPEPPSRKGYTLLMSAVMAGHVAIVKILIEKEADINKTNSYGQTALMIAVKEGKFDIAAIIAKKLTDKKVDLNLEPNDQNMKFFDWAVANGEVEIAKKCFRKIKIKVPGEVKGIGLLGIVVSAIGGGLMATPAYPLGIGLLIIGAMMSVGYMVSLLIAKITERGIRKELEGKIEFAEKVQTKTEETKHLQLNCGVSQSQILEQLPIRTSTITPQSGNDKIPPKENIGNAPHEQNTPTNEFKT